MGYMPYGERFKHPAEMMKEQYDNLYEAAAKIIKDQHAAGNQTLEIKVELPEEYSEHIQLEQTVTITFKKPYEPSRKEENVWTL